MLRMGITIIAIGLVLAITAVKTPPPALAAAKNITAVAVAPLSEAPVASPEGTTVKKAVVGKRKKRRRTSGKSAAPVQAEASSGDRMTVRQVLDVLKNSRDLSGKNLNGLHLVGMNLSKCNLKGANLSHANLERADLTESNLERADMSGANLRMASLRQAGVIAANLESVILDGAIWKDGSICARGSIGQCRLSPAPAPPDIPTGPQPATSPVLTDPKP